MSLRKPHTFSGVHYSKVSQDEVAIKDDFDDEQFKETGEKRIPCKAISLALVLFLGGITMLLIGIIILSGHADIKYKDRMWPLIIIGVLMLIPGAYHTRIAYLAYKQVPGFSYEDIPEFDS